MNATTNRACLFFLFVTMGCQKPLPEPVVSAPARAELYREVSIDASSTVKQAGGLSAVEVAWALERPSGSLAELQGETALVRTIRPDVPGQYFVTLTLSRDKQEVSRTHVMTVNNLMSLPIYLGQPWMEAIRSAGKRCTVDKVEPLVESITCQPDGESPSERTPWVSFTARSVNQGPVVDILVFSKDRRCEEVSRMWGRELAALGFKQIDRTDTHAGRGTTYGSEGGLDADIKCSSDGSFDSALELSFHWVTAQPAGTCPSPNKATSHARALGGMAPTVLPQVDPRAGAVADPSINCNEGRWAVGPAGLAGLTYVNQQIVNTQRTIRAAQGSVPESPPDWLVIQVANGLKSVKPIGSSALSLARSTWGRALKSFLKEDNMHVLWGATLTARQY